MGDVRRREWGRRWLLRGECEHKGCPRPSLQRPFSRCSEHEALFWREAHEQIDAEKFEREVQQAEALRRVLPEALAALSDTQGG